MRDCLSDLRGEKYDVFAFACQKMFLCPSFTYLLTSLLFLPFVFIFCCLYTPAVVLQMCREQIDVALLHIRCCIVVVLPELRNITITKIIDFS